MTFEFATANRIIFGRGKASVLPALAAERAKRPFVLTGRDKSRIAPFLTDLQKQRLEIGDFQISGEPDTDLIVEAATLARQHQADLVIAIGGGSVIDSGKAVASLLTNRGDLFDYLEVIGRGKPLQAPSAPCIAVPTTAGTGSEVTRNAVLRSSQHRVKVSMRSAHMLPDIALVDPELTVSMPPDLTASTGLDALTQVIEPYVSNRSNPLTDALCQKAIKLAGRSLLTACKHGEDHQAREEMSLVSLFGGLALANAKLGAVHGFAGPLGGQYNAPHGLICGRLLPEVVATNIKALEQRSPQSKTLERYRHIASWLTQKRGAPAKAGVDWLYQLVKALDLPSLKKIGVREKDIDDIVANARKSSSMKGNPVELEEKELKTILVNVL
jgi:alcohol dehydrogenase class IV